MRFIHEKPSENLRNCPRVESNNTILLVDPAAEKRLVRKCDVHILPSISILYIFSFLDRINIGNARIQGLENDLRMKGHDYNIALLIFFITYIAFELPSNILIKKIRPSTWLSGIMVCWGIITVCMGITRSFAGLVICRLLLGMCEAGFFPGSVYLISMYYRRYELQQRITFFFCSSLIAGAVSGFLAYSISRMEGIGGYSAWRWIFIIEGLATILVAGFAKFFIVDWPEKSTFLSLEERQLLLYRLEVDAAEAKMDHFDARARRRAFRDWKVYVGILMYIGIVNTGYGIAFFTPTILNQLGWTSVRAQILTIPVYISSVVATLIFAVLSDHLQHRYSFAMIGILIGTIGYSLLLAQSHICVEARYLAIFLVAIGGNITQPLTIAWLNNNMGGHFKRSISSAMQIGFGNCGGIIASNIYLASETPTFPTGFGVSLGLLWLCGFACTIFLIGLRCENRKRERGERNYRYNLPKPDLENLGDDHPQFRFTY